MRYWPRASCRKCPGLEKQWKDMHDRGLTLDQAIGDAVNLLNIWGLGLSGSMHLGNVVNSWLSSRQHTAPLSTSCWLIEDQLVVSVSRATHAISARARRFCVMASAGWGDDGIDRLYRPSRATGCARGSVTGCLVALCVSDTPPSAVRAAQCGW